MERDWQRGVAKAGHSNLHVEEPEHPHSPFMLMMVTWSCDVEFGIWVLVFGVDLDVFAWSR
jgi:hypothetical protein